MDWLRPDSPGELADLVRDRAGPDRRVLATGAPDPPADPSSAAADGDSPDALPAGASARAVGGDATPDESRPDAVISTARLSGVLEHRPRDLTVTVGAGTRVRDLAARLAEAGAWIPLAGPARELSVGGAVACALPGPFDPHHGDLRRQLLACELVTWSGERARWGRGVMKNVAGYGTTRVVAGSFGRLGVVLRATFRLWPAPEARRRVLVASTDGRPLDAADRVARSDLDAEVRPDAVAWRRDGGGERLEVRLIGSSDSVDLRLDRLRSWCEGAGLEIVTVSPSPTPGGAPDAGDDRPGRRRDADVSAAWAAAGRAGFAAAARVAGSALGGRLVRLEGYPLSGHLRCAWRNAAASGPASATGGPGPREPVDRDSPPSAREPDDAGPVAVTRLLDALDGTPVRLERGLRAELAAAEARRDDGVRGLEERVVEALGGRPRHWLSGFL